MKRIFITAMSLAVLVACNSGDNKAETKTEEKTEEKAAATDVTETPEYQDGLALVAKSDCLTCHKVDEKLTGPPYREVANKYASQAPDIIPTLAEKIVKGGSGNWGEVPMLPHPNISHADAEKMVKYILLLKK